MSNLIALNRIKEIIYLQNNTNYNNLLITYYDNIHGIYRTQLKLQTILNEFKENNINILHIPSQKVTYNIHTIVDREYWINANMINNIKVISDNKTEIILKYKNKTILEWTIDLSVKEIVKYCPKIFSRI